MERFYSNRCASRQEVSEQEIQKDPATAPGTALHVHRMVMRRCTTPPILGYPFYSIKNIWLQICIFKNALFTIM